MTVLETDRLLLRPLTRQDVDAFVALHDDDQVNEFVGSYTQERALTRLKTIEEQWALRGHGLCAVELKETGAFLGRAGLQYWKQFDEVEAGWVLRSDTWGRGYATEAAHACVDWGFTALGLDRVTAMIRPGNAPSVRVAERLGFAPLRSDTLVGNKVTVYALDRPA